MSFVVSAASVLHPIAALVFFRTKSARAIVSGFANLAAVFCGQVASENTTSAALGATPAAVFIETRLFFVRA